MNVDERKEKRERGRERRECVRKKASEEKKEQLLVFTSHHFSNPSSFRRRLPRIFLVSWSGRRESLFLKVVFLRVVHSKQKEERDNEGEKEKKGKN